MLTRTWKAKEIDTAEDGTVETEVETLGAQQYVAAVAVDTVPPSDAVVIERSSSFFERERLNAVGLVARTAIETLLGVRFLLHASGANSSSVFFGIVDDLSWPFAGPFVNVFSNRSWGPGSIEISTLVAMGVYFLVFRLLSMLANALAPRLGGVALRRGMTMLVPETRSSSTPSSAEDNHRRQPTEGPSGATRRHRRLLRRTRAREV